MNKDAEGIIAEECAGVYLEKKGYIILDKNVSFPKYGELDIVALDGAQLVIVEVKYRSSCDFGHPIEAVTKSKMRSLMRATEMYLINCNVDYSAVRFDVVSVKAGIIEHYENAFYGSFG